MFFKKLRRKRIEKNDTTKSIRNESIQNQVSTIECTSLNNDEANVHSVFLFLQFLSAHSNMFNKNGILIGR